MTNFPIGHAAFNRASSQLDSALRFEAKGDQLGIDEMATSWDLDPLLFSVPESHDDVS